MFVGYVRLKDGKTLDLNFNEIINSDGSPYVFTGQDAEIILEDDEKILKKEELEVSLSYKKHWLSDGYTLIILTNLRLILLRQPGGLQQKNAIHTNIGEIQNIQKANKAIEMGLSEFVNVNLDEVIWSIGLGIVTCSGKNKQDNFDILFNPRDKAEVFFAGFLPKNKMKKKNILAAEQLKSKPAEKADTRIMFEELPQPSDDEPIESDENLSSQIKPGEIPLSGYDKPIYCGNCGRKTEDDDCPICVIDPSTFVNGESRIPISVLAGFYFLVFIAIPLMTIATIGLAVSSETNTYVLGAAIGSVPFLGYYAVLTHKNIKLVKAGGYIKCSTCGKQVLPHSKRCVYCGQRISWFT